MVGSLAEGDVDRHSGDSRRKADRQAEGVPEHSGTAEKQAQHRQAQGGRKGGPSYAKGYIGEEAARATLSQTPMPNPPRDRLRPRQYRAPHRTRCAQGALY